MGFFAQQLPEETMCGLDIAHQGVFRDPVVGASIMAILFQ